MLQQPSESKLAGSHTRLEIVRARSRAPLPRTRDPGGTAAPNACASLPTGSLLLLPFGSGQAGAPTAANPRVAYHSSRSVQSNSISFPPLPGWSGQCVSCQDPDPKPLSGPCPASILYLTLPTSFASFRAIIFFIYSSLLPLHHPTLLLPPDSKFHESRTSRVS